MLEKLNKVAVQKNAYFTDNFFKILSQFSRQEIIFIENDTNNEALAGVDALVSSWNFKINPDILDKLPNLKFIFLRCTTTDMIDLSIIARKNIIIKNINDYSNNSTAEFVVYLMLFANRNNINRIGCELFNKKLGLIGYGKVAKIVAKIGKEIGLNVSYTNKSGQLEVGDNYIDTDYLLTDSDFISFHTPSFTNIISERQLYLIKNGAKIFITTIGLPCNDYALYEYLIKNTETELFLDKGALHGSIISKKITDLQNVYFFDMYSARTNESIIRAEKFMIDNIMEVIKL